jgi:hypothetical protein
VFEQLDGINDDLAAIVADFDADLYTGRQAQRIVCAAADLERFAITLKTLAMRRVDQTNAWKHDGARSPQGWLADKTGTTMSDASGTVELGAQLEQLPEIAAAAKNGQLSPGKTRMIASAASQDPDSEAQLLAIARTGSVTALKNECAAARLRGAGPDATAKIHAERGYRSWVDRNGAFRFAGITTVDKGAGFQKTLDGFTDQVFQDARRAGIHESHEAYAVDALCRMADAAVANTQTNTDVVAGDPTGRPTGRPTDDPAGDKPAAPAGDPAGGKPHPPAFTKSRIQIILMADAAAWTRGYTVAGETCEIAGIGPIDIATAKRMAGDAIIDIVLTHGIDVRTLAHAQHDLTKQQFVALVAQGYECNVDGCGNTHHLEIDHLGDGWAINGRTSVDDVAFKCSHHHNLKSYKRWTDGPQLPNGKRTLNPPNKPPPPPDDG